jgi:hypothetical protein
MHLGTNKLCEPFLSPLLPFHPPLPLLAAPLDSFDGQTSPSSTLSNSLSVPSEGDDAPRVETVGPLPLDDDTSPTLTNSSNPHLQSSSLPTTHPQTSSPVMVKDIYSILLKIHQLKYGTSYDLFLKDFDYLSKEMSRMLETYCSYLLEGVEGKNNPTLTPSIVKGYQETINQAFSTILFPLSHLTNETKERLANEFNLPFKNNISTSDESHHRCEQQQQQLQTLDEKLIHIWRRECHVSLTQIRESFFSQNYFEHHVSVSVSNSDSVSVSVDEEKELMIQCPRIHPRSLESWCHYLDSSPVLIANNNNGDTATATATTSNRSNSDQYETTWSGTMTTTPTGAEEMCQTVSLGGIVSLTSTR